MDTAGQGTEPGNHRFVDPSDPPREMSGLAWGAIVSLGLLGILLFARTAASLHLRAVVTGGGDVTGAYNTYTLWMSFYWLMLLVAAGAFIAWFHRAYKNLRSLGLQGMRYGTGWAIGAWFIPIFGLVRPKQIANDIWRGSEPGVEVTSGWHRAGVPRIVHWWWALFVVQGFLIQYGGQTIISGYNLLERFGPVERGFSKIETGTTLEFAGSICAFIGLVLAIKVVSQVSKRLDGLREDVPLAGHTLQPAAR